MQQGVVCSKQKSSLYLWDKEQVLAVGAGELVPPNNNQSGTKVESQGIILHIAHLF
jgi:hypothetical protein